MGTGHRPCLQAVSKRDGLRTCLREVAARGVTKAGGAGAAVARGLLPRAMDAPEHRGTTPVAVSYPL